MKTINEVLIANRRFIELGINLARGLKEFSSNRNPFSLIEHSFSFVKESYLTYNQDIGNFLKEENGWKALKSKSDQFPLELFSSVIKKYKCDSIELPHGSGTVRIHSLPLTKIAISKNRWDKDIVLFDSTQCSSQDLLDFLVEEKMKEIKSNYVSFHQIKTHEHRTDKSCTFVCEYLTNVDSDEAKIYIDKLTIARDQNKCRSFLFYGPPGTGKTTILNNIVSKLNYRTLIIDFNEVDEYDMISFVVDSFKFDAIIINDFDLTNNSARILRFIEDVRSKVKVVLATANSLKSIYPAIIRPGRFDEIIKIDVLSEHTVKNMIVGTSIDFDRIKHWPAAYINELVCRTQLGRVLEDDISELEKRVAAQLDILKDTNEK